jgi:sugar-specific transcriptional regulator TrmB
VNNLCQVISLNLRIKSVLKDECLDTQVLDEHNAELIVKYLQDFGLNEKEAIVFFTLSKTTSATASEIASITHFSHLQTYRAVKGLLDHGLVEMSLERPRRFISLKIDQAISLLSQEAERKLLDLEKKTTILLKTWSALRELEVDRTSYTFRIVQGSKNVSKFRSMLYKSAKKEISTIIKPTELTRMVLDGTDDIFELLARKNVNIRGLSEVNRYNIDANRRFMKLGNFHNIENANLASIAIIDGQEALVCLAQDIKSQVPENAIWTNHPEMVEIFKEVFETLWSASQDINSCMRKFEDLPSANGIL